MITFENIKTGAKVVFDGTQDPQARQAHMAAYLNSSNLSPNALKGQDFGWRLAPEIVAEMDRIKTDMQALDTISRRVGVGIDDVRDFHILNYIAEQDFAADALKARAGQNSSVFEASYEERLRKLREGSEPISENLNSNSEAVNAKIEVPKTIKNKEK